MKREEMAATLTSRGLATTDELNDLSDKQVGRAYLKRVFHTPGTRNDPDHPETEVTQTAPDPIGEAGENEPQVMEV